jgi:hypothetical protein
MRLIYGSSMIAAAALGCTIQSASGDAGFGGTEALSSTTQDAGSESTSGTTSSDSEEPGDDTGAVDTTTSSTTGDSSDEGSTSEPCRMVMGYADADEDGFGDPATTMEACELPQGFVENADDCDDTDIDVHPDSAETCDGGDNDCDGLVDEWSIENTTCDDCSLATLGGQVYWFCSGNQTWAGARQACLDFGADLTSIQGISEHNFIVSTLTVNHWIGLHDQITESDWQWIDETPFSYANWAIDEPNDDNGTEDCVEIDAAKDFRWNDNDCGNARAYVCEASPPPARE